MIGRTNAGGGGCGKKSLILPTNPDLSIKSDDSKLVLSWTQPKTEVEVDHYNIYTSLTEPSSLNDMALVGSVNQAWEELELVEIERVERSGITITKNDDNSYSFVGTPSDGTASVKFRISDWGTDESTIPYDTHLRMSGCPKGGASVIAGDDYTSYHIGVSSYSSTSGNRSFSDTGNGVEFDLYKDDTYSTINAVVTKNTTVDITFRPKIEQTIANTYELTNLTNDQTYYVGIQAVSVEGYENASMWKVENGVPSAFTFVTVGDDGKGAYSTDGLTWNNLAVHTGANLRTVIYKNGFFYYGGSIGVIMKINPINGEWQTCYDGIGSATINSICYGNDRFVAVCNEGKSYYSLDGKTWVAMSGLSTSYQYCAVIYGNDRFICVGQGGVSHYSTDGTSWVYISTTNYAINGVCYGNNRFVHVGLAGRSHYSTDGISWVNMSGLNTSLNYYSVCYADGVFYAISPNQVYKSTNGSSWTYVRGIGSNNNCITYSKGRLIIVGDSGTSYYSTDGISWIAMSGLDTSKNYNAVCSNTTE